MQLLDATVIPVLPIIDYRCFEKQKSSVKFRIIKKKKVNKSLIYLIEFVDFVSVFSCSAVDPDAIHRELDTASIDMKLIEDFWFYTAFASFSYYKSFRTKTSRRWLLPIFTSPTWRQEVVRSRWIHDFWVFGKLETWRKEGA